MTSITSFPAIIGYTELAQMDLEGDSPARSTLDQVIKSSIRAKNLVEQILTFSRKRQRERKPLKLAPPGGGGASASPRDAAHHHRNQKKYSPAVSNWSWPIRP